MKLIKPSVVEGAIAAPPSKSMMQRAVAMSLLTKGPCDIANPSFCEDSSAALGIAQALGADVTREENRVRIRAPGTPKGGTLDCGESGLNLRMFSAVASLWEGPFHLTGRGSLLRRPISFIEKPLSRLGASVKTNAGFPPLTVKGPLKGGFVEMDGSKSSQFLTGLLVALPACARDSELVVKDLVSKPYVRMTLSLLKNSGIIIDHDETLEHFSIPGGQVFKPGGITIEGDWSGASFLLVAGAVAGGVEVRGLDPESTQADRAILDALSRAGARVAVKGKNISVEKADLSAFHFDATQCPDLFPPLVALAVHCEGKSVIEGASRLIHKESNRAAALAEEFGKIGAGIALEENALEIKGTTLTGGAVNSHNDHRIAMALAVAGLAGGEEIGIEGWSCVEKSYPSFFSDLEYLTEKTT